MEILLYGFPAVLIVMGLVQISKKFVTKRWLPVLAIVFGILLCWLASWRYTTTEVIIQGIVVGLTAVGLFSGQKAVRGK